MKGDQRAHPRLPLEVEVELRCPGVPAWILRTTDLSHGGLLVNDAPEIPALGTPVRVQVVGTLGNDERPPVVTGRVVRHVTGGFAIAFDEN